MIRRRTSCHSHYHPVTYNRLGCYLVDSTSGCCDVYSHGISQLLLSCRIHFFLRIRVREDWQHIAYVVTILNSDVGLTDDAITLTCLNDWVRGGMVAASVLLKPIETNQPIEQVGKSLLFTLFQHYSIPLTHTPPRLNIVFISVFIFKVLTFLSQGTLAQ